MCLFKYMQLAPLRFGVAKMKGQCFVGEDLACEAELTLALGS
jgi:3-hydroxyacyl-[acyl-carrier-protein] dehydratase